MTPTKLNIMNHPKIELPVSEKAVLSPKEFAALFGRQYVWAYRQISAGNIKVLTNLGRIMIPRSEVGRLLEAQHVYAGMVLRMHVPTPDVMKSMLAFESAPFSLCLCQAYLAKQVAEIIIVFRHPQKMFKFELLTQ
jgi:hypothetical protein